MKMTKENQKEVFYVGLNDSKEVRKNVLESTRDLIQIIKDQDNLKQMRAQKAVLIEELKNQMAQIDNLMNRLKRALPSSREKEQTSPGPSISNKKKFSSLSVPRKIKDIDKLEAELADIEAKLGGM